MTLVDLDKLETLERAATPGPWDKVDSKGEIHIYCCSNSDGYIHSGDWVASAADGDEAALILGVRNALPDLIAELRAARAVVRAARSLDEAHLASEQYARHGCPNPLSDVLAAYDAVAGKAPK
jgi:hypothetical protein